MTRTAVPGRARRVARRVAVAALSLVVALILAEVGMRVWMRAQGEPFDEHEARTRMRAMLSPIQRFVPANAGVDEPEAARLPLLNPYYGSEERADTGDVFRYFREDARPDDYVVLLLGGSVAAFLGVTEGAAITDAIGAMPALRGRRVVLLNGAHAAHKQPQQVTRLAVLLTFGYRPDLVIALDGFNETVLAAENVGGAIHPLWPTAPVWSAVLAKSGLGASDRMDVLVAIKRLRTDSNDFLEQCRRYRLDRTAIGSHYAYVRLDAMNRERVRLQQLVSELGGADPDARSRRQEGGPPFDGDFRRALEVAVRGWSEGSRSVRALCESRGIAYVHYVQPALHDAGSKPMSDAEAKLANPSDAWLRGARDGYPLLREAAARLAAEGERVVDCTRVFADVTETLYFDPCHVNARGNELLRAYMLARLPQDVVGTR